MALAMSSQQQPKKEIQEFEAFRNTQNNKEENVVVTRSSSARATFKFNADAPVFVPRSQSLPAAATSFFYPYFPPYLGGGGGGSDSLTTDWIYVSEQDSNSSSNNNSISNSNNPTLSSSKDQSPKNNVLTEEMQKKILKQMEYQFSDMSLLANDNLAKQISKDPEGYVPISAVASTKKIKSLVGTNHQLIAQALLASAKLDVSSDGKRVKRKTPFTDRVKEDLQFRTIVAENLPDDHSHQNIEKIFNVAGCVKTIRICHPQDPSTRAKGDFIISTKLHALVEFLTPESAEKAVELLHDQRDWRKGLRVRCLQRRSPKSVLKNRKSEFDNVLDDDDDGLPAEIPGGLASHPTNSETIATTNTEENSATSKKLWNNKGRGKGRQQRTQMTPMGLGLGRGLLASAPLGGNSSTTSVFGEASTRHIVKGPRMPDGTRGFTMGRGGSLITPPPASRPCSALV